MEYVCYPAHTGMSLALAEFSFYCGLVECVAMWILCVNCGGLSVARRHFTENWYR